MEVLSVVKYILMAIYAVVCLALIVLIMKQNKEGGNNGTVFGASANNFYEKNKGKTREGKIKTATIILMVVFVILTIALGIIYIV